jgi:hypothetical protein
MPEEGKYIYCIIQTDREEHFSSPAIGGRGDRVHSIGYQDVGAVVSASPVAQYSISRDNTLAHMRVMEEIMAGRVMLPVKFNTVASGNKDGSVEERIRREILAARYKELKGLLARMTDKVELGLKALWVQMEPVYMKILDDHREIRELKQRIMQGISLGSLDQRIELGDMVKSSLDEKRKAEEEAILKNLNGSFGDLRRNKIFGESMIMNAAFLVDRKQIPAFDAGIERLISAHAEKIRFKYVGPVPPCNFVELVINLTDRRDERSVGSSHGI